MSLKKLNKGDVGEIVNLHRKTIIPLWKKLRGDYTIEDIKEYILDTLKKGGIVGYFVGRKLVGCGGIILDKQHNYGEVRLVLVDPKFQKKGIGKEIMKHIEMYAKRKRIRKLKLNVLIKNKAVNFYEKLGYKKYVYIMRKKLA